MSDYELAQEAKDLPEGLVRDCVADYLNRPTVRQRVKRESAGRHAIKLYVRGSSPTQAVKAAAVAFNLSESTVWGAYIERKCW